MSSELQYWWDEKPFYSALDAIAAANSTTTVPIGITFDDGNSSDAIIALPALLDRNLKASFFVCAGRIGSRNYLDKAAIRDLLLADMIVGSHGMHHVDWRRVNSHQLENELIDSKHILEDLCGSSVTSAAVPFGSYDRRVLRHIGRANYSTVFTSDGGFSTLKSSIKTRNTAKKAQQKHAHEIVEILNESLFSRIVRRAIVSYKKIR